MASREVSEWRDQVAQEVYKQTVLTGADAQMALLQRSHRGLQRLDDGEGKTRQSRTDDIGFGGNGANVVGSGVAAEKNVNGTDLTVNVGFPNVANSDV